MFRHGLVVEQGRHVLSVSFLHISITVWCNQALTCSAEVGEF